MPGKLLVFDSVALSNFLHSDSIFILKNRYRNRGVITREVYNEISCGLAEFPALKLINNLFEENTFKLISLSKREHEYFLSLIRHLGSGEASCIAVAKEQAAIVETAI